MQTYTISKESYNKLVRKRLTIVVPILAIGMLIIIGINLYTSNAGELLPLAIILPLVMALLGFSLYRGMRKQMQLALSYSLTISETEITREQNSTPTLTINFMEIKEILKTKQGGFVIKGRTGRDIIHVPSLIDNAAGLEQRLQAFAPITTTGRRLLLEQYMGLLYLVGMAGYITSLTVSNIIISTLAGVAALAVLIGMFITVRQSKNATKSMRRRSWFYLFFALMLAVTLFFKIVGFPVGR